MVVLERSSYRERRVIVELTFDLALDLKFLVTQQFPISLKQMIGEQKNEIYGSLSRDLSSPYRLVGEKVFELSDGKRFLVFFVSDLRQPSAEYQPLRVTHIEKL
jgi:hypothetical protein